MDYWTKIRMGIKVLSNRFTTRSWAHKKNDTWKESLLFLGHFLSQCLPFTWYGYFLQFLVRTSLSKMASNPLSGQHLRILATEVWVKLVSFLCYNWIMNWIWWQFLTSLKTIRNATDHVIHAEGILTHLLAALSDMRNFRYWIKLGCH